MSMVLALLLAGGQAAPMVVIDEADTVQEGPAPHGKIGQSTAWRISDTLIQPAVHSRVYRHSRTLIARAYTAANAAAPGAARVCRYSMCG